MVLDGQTDQINRVCRTTILSFIIPSFKAFYAMASMRQYFKNNELNTIWPIIRRRLTDSGRLEEWGRAFN